MDLATARPYDDLDLTAVEPEDLPYMDLTAPSARFEQVARMLRDRIYNSDEFPVGAKLPSEDDLAREHGVSRPLINRALGVLVAEGLVAAKQGSGTFVLPRRSFRVTVTVPRLGSKRPREHTKLTDAAKPVVDAEPAISHLIILTNAASAQIQVTVECGSVARAVIVAFSVARAACKDGWDIEGTEVTAGPARGRET